MVTYPKSVFKALLLTSLLFFTSTNQAALLSYDISITGSGFFGGGAYGESGPTNAFFGSLTVDNSFIDAAAVVGFSLDTGTQSWTESLLDSSSSSISVRFDSSGELVDNWSLVFSDSPGSLFLASNDTMNLRDGIDSYSCNSCVDYSKVSVVPVPAAVWLFGTAMVGLIGFSKRRKASI